VIDPHDITDFEREDDELEEFLIFCICVAGKTAEIQAKKLEKFLQNLEGKSPFQKIRKLSSGFYLYRELKRVKMGKYSNLVIGIWDLVHDSPDLRNISYKELKRYKGIGDKTSRFFILHSRKETNVACLDTHILKWMNENIDENIPKNNSKLNNKEYNELEKVFIKEAMKRNKHPAHLDLEIWNSRAYSKN